MSKTISGTITHTYTLTSTANNPVTILSTAKIMPSAVSGGYGGVYGEGGSGQGWTITNAGLINDGTNGNGIQLGQGGTYVGASVITNQSGGTIIGAYGIRMYNTASSSITNLSGGTIEATSNRGVYFNAAGTLTNLGVIIAPTLTNQQLGVLMENGGVLINNASGTISGYEGLVMIGSSTVTNAGTIKAAKTSAFAIQLGAGVGNKLIVDPGAVFVGQVYGGSGTLELASAAGAGILTAASFEHFSAVKFDAGSEWTLIGNAPSAINTTTALAGAISGFTINDTIDLTGFYATSASYAGGNLTLTNASNAHTTLHFAGGPFTTGTPHIATNGTGTVLTDVACFAEGTHIATERGDVPVETLRDDDRVRSHLSAGFVPVKWIGHRRVDCSRQPDPRKVWPVCVRAGAFGDNLPRRDLWLSPDHAVFVDDVLVPIKLLINGASIAQLPVDGIAYYHIELPCHDVLLAEGLPAESYLDVGDRSNFDTSVGVMRLFPDFATRPADIANLWEKWGCAQLIIQGPKLEAIQSWVNALADRVTKTAAAMGRKGPMVGELSEELGITRAAG